MVFKMPPIQTNFTDHQFVNDSNQTQCVEFVRQITGAPQTSVWTRGLHVKGNSAKIEKYTAIATFFGDLPKYGGPLCTAHLPGHPVHHKHAAIYLGCDGQGIQVYDQDVGHPTVRQRSISWPTKDFPRNTPHDWCNNGENFYVIEIGGSAVTLQTYKRLMIAHNMPPHFRNST
jgi:hypothetical protein